jgi:hypothetical protein
MALFSFLNYLSNDMKEIFITDAQQKILEQIIAEGKKTVPSAQKQVDGKVNAGIMDIIASGEMCEGAEPENDIYNIGMEGDCNLNYGHVNESANSFDYKTAIKSILNYMKSEGLNIYPFPSVVLNFEEQNGLFITTGYYLPLEKKVVLFCKERHPKDILRSFAHELIHHMQNLEGKNLNFTNDDDVKDNKELEALESEAYLKGNIFFRKWTEYERNKSGVLNEGIISISQLREMTKDLDEALTPDEVDLSSFNIKKNLNPKFWKDGKLDSRIRMKLLDIADDFIEYLNIDWVKPKDIIITGSLANYNWNENYSDIDLHILIDYKEVDERTDFVSNYFYSLKKLWNDEHDKIRIFNFPVELYVQDYNEIHNASGVYSLEKNEWLEEPERKKLTNVKINKNYIQKEVSSYTEKIDALINIYIKNKKDSYKLEKVFQKAEKLFDEIKTNRRNSLNKSDNELNSDNLIFKSLRRNGYINKLSELITNSYDKLNSLP